jgi:hypothetical protein
MELSIVCQYTFLCHFKPRRRINAMLGKLWEKSLFFVVHTDLCPPWHGIAFMRRRPVFSCFFNPLILNLTYYILSVTMNCYHRVFLINHRLSKRKRINHASLEGISCLIN